MHEHSRIELHVPVSAELLERATQVATADVPEDPEAARANAAELEELEREIGKAAIDGGLAAITYGEEPEPPSPGTLALELLSELSQWTSGAYAAAVPDRHAYIASLASAADDLDRIRARRDAEEISPAIAPDLLKRASTALARAGLMLNKIHDVQGRFVPGDHPNPDLGAAEWARVRIVPDGFEDLDGHELQRLAIALFEETGQ